MTHHVAAQRPPAGAPPAGPKHDDLLGTLVTGGFAFAVLANIEGWPALPSGAMEAVLVVTAAFAVWRVASRREALHLLPLALAVFISYAVVTLVSVLVATDPQIATETWMKLLRALVVGLTGYLLASEPGRLRALTWGAVLGTATVSLAAVAGLPWPLSGLDAIDDNQRLTGPLGDGNFFAQFLVVGLALALGTMWRQPLVRPLAIGAATCAAALLAIVATGSRGAFLAVVALAFIVLRGMNATARLLAIVLLVVPVGWLLSSHTITERLARAPASVGTAVSTGVAEDGAVAGRLSENIAGLRMFLDQPVAGVGIGNYPRHYLDHSFDIGIDRRVEERNAHNLHLEVAAETGLIGLVVWLIALGAAIGEINGVRRSDHDAAELHRMARAWGMALAGWLVTSVFLHDNYPGLQWLLIGVCLGIGEARRRTTAASAAPALRP